MIEKYENCPDCNKALDQAEYDGQYCRSCGTEPFGFQKPKGLAGMISYVEARKRLIDDVAAAYAPDNRNYSAEREARKEAVALARNALESVGAKTRDEWNVAAIKLMGIRSTCTWGFSGALGNWLRAARAKLEQGKAA